MAFCYPHIAIYDGDVNNGRTADPTEFYTTELCFEIEIIKKLLSSKKAGMIRQIALDFDNQAENVVLDVDFVHKHYKKMGIDLTGYIPKSCAI